MSGRAGAVSPLIVSTDQGVDTIRGLTAPARRKVLEDIAAPAATVPLWSGPGQPGITGASFPWLLTGESYGGLERCHCHRHRHLHGGFYPHRSVRTGRTEGHGEGPLPGHHQPVLRHLAVAGIHGRATVVAP